QLNGLETLVIIMVANKYAFLQITRRRFLNEWEAFKKVISRRNIRRRITIPLTLSNLKLLRRITRTENILHRNFTGAPLRLPLVPRNGCGRPGRAPERFLPLDITSLLLHVIFDARFLLRQ